MNGPFQGRLVIHAAFPGFHPGLTEPALQAENWTELPLTIVNDSDMEAFIGATEETQRGRWPPERQLSELAA